MNRLIALLAALVAAAAVLPIATALVDSRDQKLEVYRAFATSFGEGNPINLSNTAHRFDASIEDVIFCAPTALLTTAISRHFRTQTLLQSDFPDPSVRVVDADVQRAVVHARDPSWNIEELGDVDEALDTAFESALLEVSDIGFNATGQRAILTFSFSCGMLCGSSATVMFERRGDRWVRSQQECGAVSIS